MHRARADAAGEVAWDVGVDSLSAWAQQHASGTRRRPYSAEQKGDPPRRGRGHRAESQWATTKVHVACGSKGRLLSVVITAGQRHDSPQLEPVLDAYASCVPEGLRKRPDHIITDKDYSYERCRQVLRRRGIAT